jgi:3-oxoacid CoA-transferase subunit A
MVYITGDTHGKFERIEEFCYGEAFTEDDDVLVILGDVGLNYYGDTKDRQLKEQVSELPVTLLCIHGNHEIRPRNIKTYEKKQWRGGDVYWEPEFPNILFAIDGEIYALEGKRCIALGGAHSMDKKSRTIGISWWPDEQPSETIMEHVQNKLHDANWQVDYVFSHTCPRSCLPYSELPKLLDKSDLSGKAEDYTESWLDNIHSRLNFTKWYCGHFHVDGFYNGIHFMEFGYDELDVDLDYEEVDYGEWEAICNS